VILSNVEGRHPDSFLGQKGDLVMNPRMKNPAMVVPEALPALLAVGKVTRRTSVPQRTLELVQLRVSQINGCSLCVDMHARDLKKGGETDQRVFAVAAWREAPFFTDAERAALALGEAATRLSDRTDPINDETWNEAARHYDEAGLASLVLNIAMVNFWNRVNVTTRQIAGSVPG
jgi:AhpD family alkylhydroperoxidase